MIKERMESSGIITRYDVIKRTMTVLDRDKNLFKGVFHQSMINYPTRVVLEIESHCRSDCKYCSEGPFLQRTGARLAKTTVKAMIAKPNAPGILIKRKIL